MPDDADGGQVLTVTDLAARILAAALAEGDDLRTAGLFDQFGGDLGARDDRLLADLDAGARANHQHFGKFDLSVVLLTSSFSTVRTSSLATRYCLPPVLMTAYMSCLFPRVIALWVSSAPCGASKLLRTFKGLTEWSAEPRAASFRAGAVASPGVRCRYRRGGVKVNLGADGVFFCRSFDPGQGRPPWAPYRLIARRSSFVALRCTRLREDTGPKGRLDCDFPRLAAAEPTRQPFFLIFDRAGADPAVSSSFSSRQKRQWEGATGAAEMIVRTASDHTGGDYRFSTVGRISRSGPSRFISTVLTRCSIWQRRARSQSGAARQLDAVSRAWLVSGTTPICGGSTRFGAASRPAGRALFFRQLRVGLYVPGGAVAGRDESARLIRVLDWKTPGLGRNIVAVAGRGPAGRYVTLTWPGYTGVLSAVAPGVLRGAQSGSHAQGRGVNFYLDWAANRRRVWTMPHPTPAHLLRSVCDSAGTFDAAVERLQSEPISTPAIYSVAGLAPGETAVIERCETEARVHRGSQVAANHWQRTAGAGIHVAAIVRAGCHDADHRAGPRADFAWLRPPVLNARTRLAMVGDARAARVVAQVYEDGWPPHRPCLRSTPEPSAH